MKTRLVAADLDSLGGAQKQRLRGLWKPQVYDMVVIEECTDVIADTYSYRPFLVLDVLLVEANADKRSRFSSNPVDRFEYYETVLTLLSIEAAPDTPYEALVQETSTEFVLPLMDISQMLMALSSKKLKKSIFFTESIDRFFQEKDPDLESLLCDELWSTLKDCLS